MTNKVVAVGRLININMNPDDSLKLRVLIIRSGQRDAYVNFYYNGELGENIHVNDVISIEGAIDIDDNIVGMDGKTTVKQFLRAYKVSLAEGYMMKCFNIKDHFNPEHEFKVFLEGTVDSLEEKDSKKNVKILYEKMDGETIKILTSLYFHERIKDDYNRLSVGNKVVCYIDINTVKVENEAGEKVLEYLIIEDFSIIQ